MTILCKFPIGQSRYRRMLAAGFVVSAILLSACVETGDFGRRKSPVFSGKSAFDPAPQLLSSAYTLSDDEAELRARAARFQKPPRAPVWGNLELLDDLIGSDFETYYGRLAGLQDQSPRARYRRLQTDVAADAGLIAPFRLIACRVQAADRRRLVQRADIELAEQESNAFAVRLADNAALIADVERRMAARRGLYRASLDRLRVSSPDHAAAEVAPLLDGLDHVLAAKKPCT